MQNATLLARKTTEKYAQCLYQALLRVWFTYLGGAPKTTLSIIDRNIRKTLRIMMFRKRPDSAIPLYQRIDILPLASNIKLLQSKFMKKLIDGEQPEPIKMHYPLNYNDSIINSKQYRLVAPFYRTKIGTSSLLYQGFKLWNDIPFVFKTKPYIFAKEFQKTLSDDLLNTPVILS